MPRKRHQSEQAAERERAERRAAAIAAYNAEHVIAWQQKCEFEHAAYGEGVKSWPEYVRRLRAALDRLRLMKCLGHIRQDTPEKVRLIRLLKNAHKMPDDALGSWPGDTWITRRFPVELVAVAERMGPAKKRGAPKRNQARNKWIIEQHKKKKTCEAILNDLLVKCEQKGWNSVSSPQAIHAIIVRNG